MDYKPRASGRTFTWEVGVIEDEEGKEWVGFKFGVDLPDTLDISPDVARRIARALNKAADEVEE